MEVSAVQNAAATSALAKSLNADKVSMQILLQGLEQIQQQQAELLKSLGIGMNVNIAV